MSDDPIGELYERLGRLERLVALLLQKLESEGVIKGPTLPQKPPAQPVEEK